MPKQDNDSDLEISRDWLTPRQAAKVLQVSVRSIYRAVDRRELCAARVNHRGDLRISRAWLAAFMAARVEDRGAS